MLDNTNKMLADPKFEELGWQGWRPFKDKFVSIYRDYKDYGDIVLEKKLGESMEVYRHAFESENFIETMFEIWSERYHYVIKDLSELISLYEQGSLKNTYLTIESSNAGKEQSFSISTELYDYIERTAEKHGVDKLVVLKEKNVYKFYLKRVDGFHYKIKLEKLDAIEIE